MVITGTNNSDVINGTAQGDVIYGLGGNNTINAVGGNNILIGNDVYQSSIALAPTLTSPLVFFADGAPAFSPDGTKLAYWGEDINTGYYAIYVANLITGTVTQEGGPGFQYPGPTQLSWSPNGTELAISTSASGQGAPNDNGNIFVLNLSTGQFTLVSANASGVLAASNGSTSSAFSYDPVFSPDGNEVLFSSNATNLVTGSIANGQQQEVYLKNLTTGAVTEISTGTLGNQGTLSSASTPQGSTNAVFSADGTEVAFQSDDNNLTADTPKFNGLDQIYVKNLLNGDLNLESQYVTDGTEVVGNGISENPEFSPDGNEVVFSTSSPDFPGSPASGYQQVYTKNLVTQQLSLVSDTVDGSGNVTLGNGSSTDPSFTSDGHFIVYDSTATNLASGYTYTPGLQQVFIDSPSTGQIVPLSQSSSGTLGNSYPGSPVVSPYGDVVAFTDTGATNLVPNNTNPNEDIYIATAGLSPLNLTGLSASGNDILNGGPGNDILVPGPANNTLNGGAGWNMAAYHFASSQVTITQNANGSWTIAHPGGSDTLTNVELLNFSDKTMALRQVAPNDFFGSNSSDLLFRNTNGNYALWETNATSVIGGGNIGSPGSGWTVAATGNFNGTDDILFESTSGTYAAWDMNGTTVAGVLTFGSPGAGWTFTDIADFTGDGNADILFQNTAGTYATWETNGTSVVGSVNFGNPGNGWSFQGVGDFNGDGKSDILFQNNGTYAAWEVNGTAITVATFGNPGTGWSFEGLDDFYGTGSSDILFENTAGNYAIWQTNGTAVVGGGNIGSPGSGWSFVGIGDYNGDGKSDILFQNTAGTYAAWEMNGTSVASVATFGSPGPGWSLQHTS